MWPLMQDVTPVRVDEWSLKSESGRSSEEKSHDDPPARKLVYSPEEKSSLSCVSGDKAVVGCFCCLERSVLDSLVGTILSQNTTDANSSKAFHNLKRSFSSWEEVRDGSPLWSLCAVPVLWAAFLIPPSVRV